MTFTPSGFLYLLFVIYHYQILGVDDISHVFDTLLKPYNHFRAVFVPQGMRNSYEGLRMTRKGVQFADFQCLLFWVKKTHLKSTLLVGSVSAAF